MATYLITGGAGFIGSNIAKKLVEMGETVRILDDLSTGKPENIATIKDKIEFIQGDFIDLSTAKRAAEGVDYILHQGAIPSVPRSVDDPLRTNTANIVGTLNMLIAARDAKVKRFVYAASSSAYGDSLTMPKVETMETRPKSPYALQKLVGEEYCKLFWKLYGLETVCLRYFNVFGPNQDPTSVYSAVIPLFTKAVLDDKSPLIHGDGLTSRDFTYVENNVDANIKACHASRECAGEVINIACGTEVTLNELLEKINALLGKNVKAVYDTERRGDVKHSLADIRKAERLLGYKPIVSFDEGLAKTIEFYRSN